MLNGGGQLLAVHQKVTITGDGKNHAPGRDGRGNARRHAVAHGPHGGRELRFAAFGQPMVLENRCSQLAKLPAPLVSTASAGRCFCSRPTMAGMSMSPGSSFNGVGSRFSRYS